MKITKEKAIVLFNNLESIGKLEGARLAYVRAKNKKLLLPEVESIQEAQKQSPLVQEYEKERIELCKKHSKKDEKGEALMINNIYDIVNMVKFNKDLEKIQESHKEAVEELKKQNEDVANILKEEIEVELLTIKEEDLPKNITGEQTESIIEIIE